MLYQYMSFFFIFIIITSVLPKGRSFTANSVTKAAVLPKGRYSTANLGTMVAVLLGMNRCGSFPLLSAPQSLFSIEQTLKDPRGNIVEVRRVDLANWALQISLKFTTGVKYQFIRVFDLKKKNYMIWKLLSLLLFSCCIQRFWLQYSNLKNQHEANLVLLGYEKNETKYFNISKFLSVTIRKLQLL